MTPLVEHQLGDLANPGISINYERELLIWGRACIDEIQKERAHIPLTFLMALHYIISEIFFATLFPHMKISCAWLYDTLMSPTPHDLHGYKTV